MATTGLTLYSLQDELAQLVALRSDMEISGEDTAEIDAQIVEYLQALPTKIDAVAHVLRTIESQIELAKTEATRMLERRQRFEHAYDRLEQYVKDVLAMLPEPRKGKTKKLEGENATLALRGNGGVQPLEITDPNLIPDSLCMATVTLSYSDWQKVVASGMSLGVRKVEREPDNKAIREELERPCWICDGGDLALEGNPCGGCGGSGKTGVPGARLLPRGNQLRIE